MYIKVHKIIMYVIDIQVTINMSKQMLIFLLTMSLLCISYEENQSLHYFYQNYVTQKSEHYLVKWKAWQFLSLLGLFGTISNSFLMYIFYSERKIMATSVNAMICMDTLYRLVYATVSIQWRTYNMVQEQTLFHGWLDRDQVEWLARLSRSFFQLLK